MTSKPAHPPLVLLERAQTAEARAVLGQCAARNIPLQHAYTSELVGFRQALLQGAMPVGSVDFVQEVLVLLGNPIPEWNCYPACTASFLRRPVNRSTLEAIKSRCFIKPVASKLFDGFVFDPSTPPGDRKHERRQLDRIGALPVTTPIWVSTPVEFVSEWRYYVSEGKLLARAMYGSTDSQTPPQPAIAATANAVLTLWRHFQHPFVMDVGVLSTGETALVECNDAYALGLVPRSLSATQYFDFLYTRWKSIMANVNAPEMALAA